VGGTSLLELSLYFNNLIRKDLIEFRVSPEESFIFASARGIVHLMKYC
jgi:hypothetical protein